MNCLTVTHFEELGTKLGFFSDFVTRNRQLETEKVNLQKELEKSKMSLEKSDFDIEEFKVLFKNLVLSNLMIKRSMAKATQENEKLRAQNKELNADIAQIQGLVGDFAKQQQNNDSIIAQFRLSDFSNKIFR